MNKFFEFLKDIFALTDEQIEKANLELNKEEQKEEVKLASDDVQTANASPSEDKDKGSEDIVSAEEYKALQKELKEVKDMLSATQAERAAEKRTSKINSVKDCIDYGVLTSLLDGVEDKDIDAKVEEIKKEKGYLFKKVETDGFNPATPQNTLTGVEAEFLKLNPNIKL